jgi:hypothetical protein
MPRLEGNEEGRVRRLLATMTVAGMGLVVVPAAANAQVPTQDSATGASGPSMGVFQFFDFDATSGPSGADPAGMLVVHLGGGNGPTWRGNVSCLSVSGNTAIIGFGGDYFSELHPSGPRFYWVAGWVRVTDVGPGPGDTFEWVDQMGEPYPDGDPLPGPTDCSSFPPGGRQIVLSGPEPGDIVVTDAVDPSRTCAGRPATITGSGTLTGTPGADVIVGSDGEDAISGGGGDDVICARGGADEVSAGPGTDSALGDEGDDELRGGRDGDLLLGQAGNDLLRGVAGADLLYGQPGDDSLFGGADDDRLDGGIGANICTGGPGADTFTNCGASPSPA